MRVSDSPARSHPRAGFFSWLQIIISIFLGIYIIWKAATLSITQDEAYSYFLAKTDYWKAMPGSANTHWLNTLCMRLLLFLPGSDDPWKLRMLSMISWPFYAYASGRLGTLFSNKWIGFSFFLIMVMNPFLLFFFSIGRGYAAACAAVAFSIWLASKRLQSSKTDPRSWLPVFTWACVAVLCNFSALYYLLALSVCYLLALFQQGELKLLTRRPWQPLVHIVISTCCFSAASLLFINYYSGDLEHGGKTDLPGSLFGSLISHSIYVRIPATIKTISGWTILITLCLTAGYQLYQARKTNRFSIYTFLPAVMILIVLLNFAFHQLLGIPYLLDRTTLVFFTLLVVSLFLIISKAKRFLPTVAMNVTGLLIIILAVFNFYKSFSLHSFKEWPMQENSIKAYDFLQQQNAQHVAMDVWQYSVLHNYYRHAYPGRFRFRYDLVNYRHLTDSTGASIKHYDYLLLSGPVNRSNNITSHWTIAMKDSLTSMRILANPAFQNNSNGN